MATNIDIYGYVPAGIQPMTRLYAQSGSLTEYLEIPSGGIVGTSPDPLDPVANNAVTVDGNAVLHYHYEEAEPDPITLDIWNIPAQANLLSGKLRAAHQAVHAQRANDTGRIDPNITTAFNACPR